MLRRTEHGLAAVTKAGIILEAANGQSLGQLCVSARRVVRKVEPQQWASDDFLQGRLRCGRTAEIDQSQNAVVIQSQATPISHETRVDGLSLSDYLLFKCVENVLDIAAILG